MATNKKRLKIWLFVAGVIILAIPLSAIIARIMLKEKGYELVRLTLTVKDIEYKDSFVSYDLSIGEGTYIHDTDYFVRLVDFIPDFSMDTKTGKVSSLSSNLNNPAAKIELLCDDKHIYETWTFQNQEPVHRIRPPGFYFEISNIKMYNGRK